MGMDVFGKSGNYFRANVWSWHPIAAMLEELFPAYAEKSTCLHTNDGDGLDGESAFQLARLMEERRDEIRQWVDAFNAAQDAIPDVACDQCQGTGTRTDQVGQDMGMPDKVTQLEDGTVKTGWCNGCKGKGHRRPFSARYGVDHDHMDEFIGFVGDSEGFEIW